MRKSLLLSGVLCFVICCTAPALAQIPNGGFETWSGSELSGWAAINITKVSTAHSGSSAARGDVTQPAPGFPVYLQPVLQSGPDGGGFAFNQRPAAFTGFYQFFPAAGSGDRFAINVVLFKGGVSGQGVGFAAAALSTPYSSYTQFSVPFAYASAATPDTCVVQIQLIGPGTGGNAMPRLGSYFILDDLGFSGTASAIDGRNDPIPSSFELQQNYPNPFNPSTTISYSIAQAGFVSLRVYTVLGEEIATLVNDRRDAGSFSVNWNAGGRPSGIYVYRLSVASEKGMLFDQTKKMTLVK